MFRTDKIDHGFLPTYLGIMNQLTRRQLPPVVVELGVRDGSSLEMWQTLSPQSLIIGVDNSADCKRFCPPGTFFIHSDQAADELPDEIAELIRNETGGYQFVDLLVDDASHLGPLTLGSFQNLWHLVAPGGYYVIEDWYVGFEKWRDYDRSMLDLVELLIGNFDTKPLPNDVDSMELRYGLAILRKR